MIELPNADVNKHDAGPFVVDDHLFFRLLDGSIVSCDCISEPYASQIVALFHNKE